MKTQTKLVEEKFIEYQNHFKDIVDRLKNGHLQDEYKEWKGFITINGPVLFCPDILFVGINPGPGLYNETKKVPFRILPGENSCYQKEELFPNRLKYRSDGKTIEFDWFTDGN